MTKQKGLLLLQVLNTISLVVMVTINALANALPINGINSGEVSDSYPNLFAPAGLTFSIWGVIYLLLIAFTLYQLGVFNRKGTSNFAAVKNIGWYFVLSSFANAAWIFSWHYKIIPLSMVLILVILLSLIAAYKRITKSELTVADKVFIRLPFSVYFGWLTVATIANATTLLVSLGWTGGSISQPVWMIIVLAVGLAIGVWTILKNKDIAYGLVLVWAYGGILLKHLSPDGFAGKYTAVIIAVVLSLAVFLVSLVTVAIQLRKKK